jgi:hypothetical protein
VETLIVETQQYDPASPTDTRGSNPTARDDSPAATSKQIVVDNYAAESAGACASGVAASCVSVAVNTWGVPIFRAGPSRRCGSQRVSRWEATSSRTEQGWLGVAFRWRPRGGTNTVNVTLPHDMAYSRT